MPPMTSHHTARRLGTTLAVTALAFAPGAGIAEAMAPLGTDVAAPDQQGSGIAQRLPTLGTDVAAPDQQAPEGRSPAPDSDGDAAPVIILSLVAAASLGGMGFAARNAVRNGRRDSVAG